MKISNSDVVWVTGDGLRFPKGNASTNRLAEVAKGFQSNECRVKLIPLAKPDVSDKGTYNGVHYEYQTKIQKEGISKLINRLKRPFQINKEAKEMSKICKKERVSFIFYGTSSIFTIMMLNRVGRICNIPVVYDIVEDPLALWLTRELKYFSLKEWIQHTLNLLKLPLYYFYGWKLPDYICVITEELKRRVTGLGIDETRVINFPIIKYKPKHDYHLKNLQVDQDITNTLIHAGSTYFPKDGILEILESIRILSEKGIDIKLDFYGPIGIVESDRINSFAQKYEIEESIRIKGLVDLPILFEAQRKALALICFKPPNRQNRYNFATKLIDYLDSGAPVILSPLPVYDTYFQDGKNAFICGEFTGAALADKVEFIYKNPKQARRIGHEGNKTLRKKFDASKLTASLLNLIGQK